MNPVLETHNLTRRYGDLLAVDGVNLHVPQGSVYGFLGPNGAGKTTTIRMLLGLIRPDAGTVALFGQTLDRRRAEILARVGALVETPSLYPHLTGRENMAITRRLRGASRADVDAALATVRLEKSADRRAGTYSLGMQQRLGLALALLGDPDLLILDEPTNGLDPAGIQEMRELIRRLPAERGISVFLSSHLLSEIEQVATHIGVIHRGRLRFEGTLAELQAQRAPLLVLRSDSPERAIGVLRGAGWQVSVPNGDQTLEVAVTTPDEAAAVNRVLVDAGVAVYHLALEQPTLEATFLTMTDQPDGERSL